MKNFCRDSRFQVAHYIANLLFNKFRFWGSRKLARFISFLLLGRYKTDTVCHTIYRFKLKVNPNFGKDIYYLGFYEVGTIHVINNVLRQGDTFMDVGSSVGLLSFIASNIVRETGQVFSFEPEESSFKHLVDNISINKSKNIKPFNVGLGNENQVIRIYKNRGCPSMVKEEETKLVENVKIVKLDELIESENIKKVKLIKIDVEGFELEVLKGSVDLLEYFDYIYVECSFIELYEKQALADEVITFLNNYSFKLKGVYNMFYDKKGIAIQADFLFSKGV